MTDTGPVTDGEAVTDDTPGPRTADATLISGRFQLGELIGSGGSASVFAAADSAAPGIRFALKLLHPHLSGSEASRTAFFAEAHAAGRVVHPNVVRVLASGVHDSAGEQRAWIAFERAPGIALDELVATRGPLLAADALAATAGILGAVEAIHDAGLVHRDLAPSNIAVAPSADGSVRADAVRVLDFGLADAPGRAALGRDVLRSSDASDADRAVGVLGSVNYLSPEHALGRLVDERGDVYQVAALLHFMVTGRPPFVRATIGEVLTAHTAAPPPVPSVQVSGIPRSIDRIVVRGMLKQPDARFESAAAMRTAVLAAAEALQRPTPATSATRVLARGPGDAPTAVIVPIRMPSAAPRVPGAAAAPTTVPDQARPPLPSTPLGPRPRTIAVILALAAVALATIWLVGAGSAPRSVTPPTSAPPSSTAAHPTDTPTTTPTRQAPTTVPVPTFSGLTRSAAEQRARSAGLVIGTVTRRDGTQPDGIVLASDPPAGAATTPGSTVALVVASGANAVPAVAGISEVAAGSAVTASGFLPSERTVIDTTVPAGTVLGTEPAAGVSARLGSTVVIVIARGPEATPTPDPTDGPTPSPTGPPPTTGPHP